ncbi:MAG: ORF6N domain-containing protein [Oscillospiraceae bacterium]|jgi:hypothetical protein|nr:ORF6N domain-containing protein [Oscillospiraceae bacterium]
MTNKIKIGGLVTIGDMKFHDIEGGFGKDKRAMLVKEIAEIHGKEIKYINKQINANRKHFIDGKDILDLAGTKFEVHLVNHRIFSQNSINRSENIYILSERGYFKLLKILEDDLAWEKYGELLDGYFHMRKAIKEGLGNVPRLGELNAAARIIMPTLKEAGMPPQYQAVALQSLYKPVGVTIPLDGIKTDKQLFNCTEIAEKLGMASKAGKPHYQAVAAIITQIPVSDDERSLVPYQSNVSGHGGPTWQYAQSVVDKVQNWLIERNYPSEIVGGGKTFKATYKFKPAVVGATA